MERRHVTDFVLCVVEKKDGEPDASPPCPRCGSTTAERAVIAMDPDLEEVQGHAIAYVWCEPCFLIKADTFTKLAAALRSGLPLETHDG